MLIKRLYQKPQGWVAQYNHPDSAGRLPNPHRAEGALLNPPSLDRLHICHTGLDAEQHFSERLVTRGLEEGWMARRGSALTVYATPQNLTYEIVRAPGRYSCFDGSKLPDDEDDSGRLARAVITERHGGQPSPDRSHPAGYYKINYYDCVLNAEQQQTFQLRKGKR